MFPVTLNFQLYISCNLLSASTLVCCVRLYQIHNQFMNITSFCLQLYGRFPNIPSQLYKCLLAVYVLGFALCHSYIASQLLYSQLAIIQYIQLYGYIRLVQLYSQLGIQLANVNHGITMVDIITSIQYTQLQKLLYSYYSC